MKRARRRLFNTFAFLLLAFSIYLNFFYKEEHAALLKSKPAPELVSKSAVGLTVKSDPAVKK